jgi:hypothetical protein
LITGVCSTFGAANAAAVSATTPVPQNANVCGNATTSYKLTC